jgi:hypothetical protein
MKTNAQVQAKLKEVAERRDEVIRNLLTIAESKATPTKETTEQIRFDLEIYKAEEKLLNWFLT